MPVLVTTAQQPLARRVAARLLAEGGEVRVTADGDVGLLRAQGAFVAHASRDDEGRLEAALQDVHTLVHVGGGIESADPRRVVADAEVVARAATGAGIRRLVALSLPGASEDARDPLRRAKAAVEWALAGVPCQTIVVRVGLLDTVWLRDALLTSGLSPELLATVVRPVRVEDLLELVVAFDRARAAAPAGHLVVAADGPVACSVAGYLDRVTGSTAGRGSRLGRRLPAPGAVERLAAVLAGPWDQDGEVAAGRLLDGWSFAGLEPTEPGPAR